MTRRLRSLPMCVAAHQLTEHSSSFPRTGVARRCSHAAAVVRVRRIAGPYAALVDAGFSRRPATGVTGMSRGLTRAAVIHEVSANDHRPLLFNCYVPAGAPLLRQAIAHGSND